MSARSKVWGACRTLAVRAGPAAPRTQQISFPLARRQWYSSDESRSNKTPPPPPEVNAADYLTPEKSDALPSTHGTSAAAVQGQGLEHGESPIDKLDEAELERIFYGGRVAPQDGEPGLTEAQEEALYSGGSIVPADQAEALVAAAAQQSVATADSGDILDSPGHKYPLPTRPYPADFNHKKRYHPVLDQMIRLMMRDGKLSVAQRNMAIVMNYLRTSPAPIYSPNFPLLPGTPPASHLPLNPVLYMTIAIDSVAPLLKIKNVAGAAGGGRALEVPVPLALRQRRRLAFNWILDVVEKKPSKGSGRKQFPYRIAEEIVAVVEGRSSVWDKRKIIHKQGTAARANAGSAAKGKKKKM